MAKKAPAKPAAKRKPRNAIVDNAPQIAELAKRMEAERARIIAEMAAEEEAKKKPVDGSPVIPDSVVWDVDADVFKIGKDAEIKLYDFEQALKKQLAELGYEKEPLKSSSPWRRFMLVGAAVAGLVVSFGGGVWSAGGVDLSPSPKNDIVAQSFQQYETLWRAIQLETAKKLESGEFTTSQQVTSYRSLADGEALKKSRQPILDAEFAAFGGDKWTADKAAKQFRSYAE